MGRTTTVLQTVCAGTLSGFSFSRKLPWLPYFGEYSQVNWEENGLQKEKRRNWVEFADVCP